MMEAVQSMPAGLQMCGSISCIIERTIASHPSSRDHAHYTTVAGRDELYDMKNDPLEDENVIVGSANAELVVTM